MADEADEKAAEQERIRKKMEALAKADKKETSGRKSYKASLEQERNKQNDLKMDAKKRREELCETLGRGC